MTGTIINVIAILVGGTLGVVLGGRLPERLRHTVMAGLGLFVFAIGLQMFLNTKNSLVVLVSLVIGILLGEWWQVEEGIRRLGRWLERHIMHEKVGNPAEMVETAPAVSAPGATTTEPAERQERFVRGFFTASLLFCVGPIAILGSLQDGLNGNFQLLAVKAVLDGFASLAFASSLGIGVLFSVLPLFMYQGGISLAAAQLQSVVSQPMMNEMTATGGIILMTIAVGSLLEIKPIRSGNFLPALLVAPLIVALLTLLGIPWASLP